MSDAVLKTLHFLGQPVLVLLCVTLAVHTWLLQRQVAILHAVVQSQTEAIRLHSETLESLARTATLTTEHLTTVSQALRDHSPVR